MLNSFFVTVLLTNLLHESQQVHGFLDFSSEKPGLRSSLKGNPGFSSDSSDPARFQTRSLNEGTSFLKVEEEVKVNTFTPLNQEESRVAALSDGKIVVVYMSNRQDGSGEGVYYRIFDEMGIPMMPEESLVTDLTNENQSLPSVAALPSGKFIVSWETEHLTADLDIFARVFTNDGSPEGKEFLVNDVSLDGFDQTQPHMVVLENEDILILFSDDTSGTSELKGQLLDPSGAKINSNFNVHGPKTTSQEYPQAAVLDESAIFVVWEDGGVYGSISGSVVETDGTVIVPEFTISTTSYSLRPSICRLSDESEFIVTWCSGFPFANQVFGQVFDSNGNLVGPQLTITPSAGFFVSSTVACLSDGGFAVAYADASNDNYVQVVRYNKDFAVSGTPYNYSTGSNGDFPSAIATHSGGFAFTWSRNPSLISTPDIYLSVAIPCPESQASQNGIGATCPCPANKELDADGFCVCKIANSDPETCECPEGQILSENACIDSRRMMSDVQIV